MELPRLEVKIFNRAKRGLSAVTTKAYYTGSKIWVTQIASSVSDAGCD